MGLERKTAHDTDVILIVDDDPALRSSLAFILQIEGYSARTFATAAELLDDPSLPTSGCLVVDQRLPDMTGLDLITQLRRRAVRLPAILVTTHPSRALQQRAAEEGVPIVEKPLLTGALFQRINAALMDRK
jgi:two-component system, LuxR family, response regulator FixJ